MCALLASAGLGCAAAPAGPTATPETTTSPSGRPKTNEGASEGARTPAGDELLTRGEQALDDGQPARAAALFARYLGASSEGSLGRAYLGLARAQEQLGDFEAAISAYDGLLDRAPEHPEAARALARRGACEAEIGQWERSAASYSELLKRGELLPSQRVEALARRGYALFQVERFEDADAALAEADAVHERATQGGEERFSDRYFVAMARFYRAAILHRRFRAVRIRLPEARMQSDFERKLELLERAQEAYNHTIGAKHLFWVSAAGYQLGSMFSEFYDALMYAPVPEWLDAGQLEVYYRELEVQLRPVVDKAIWVLEKNLETARKFGYANDFIAQSEDRLAQLQSVRFARGSRNGPLPRLAPEVGPGRPQASDGPAVDDEGAQLPAIDRKLFVPLPTTL